MQHLEFSVSWKKKKEKKKKKKVAIFIKLFSEHLLAITQVLITIYNATIYVNFNNTIAFTSLKLKYFNVIKIYAFIF
jgi:hypothetical protein